MKTLILALWFVCSSAFAATLEDVAILNAEKKKDGFELKVHSKDGPKDSFFFVEFSESDPGFAAKMGHVLKKLKDPSYQLNFEIPSFSVSPSGSSYGSEWVTVYGSERAPTAVKKSTKKNK